MCGRKNPRAPRSGKQQGEKVLQTPGQGVSPAARAEGHGEAAVPLRSLGAAEMDLQPWRAARQAGGCTQRGPRPHEKPALEQVHGRT